MRKIDVKPGVIYSYQDKGHHPVDSVVPIVFLSDSPWIGILRQDTRGHVPGRAFKRPGANRKLQPGTVSNDGAIGYPAALIPQPATPAQTQIDKLLSLKLRDFDTANTAVSDEGYEFVLVTSMARVTGQWEESPR